MSVHDNDNGWRRRTLELEYELNALTYRSVLRYRVLPALAALAFFTIAPWIHIGGTAYLVPKPEVDRSKCRNHCFDTVYRGAYEWAPSHYKPVYFNAVPETLKIVFHTLIYVIVTYEIIRHVVLCWMTSSIRYRMMFPIAAFVYPVYYTWWSFFNYINERFHTYWYHDGYFAVTEIISLLFFVHFCDRKIKINATKLLIPFTLNLTHILVGGVDQFVENIFFGRGEEHYAKYRNLALLIPDLMILVVCLYELRRLSRKTRTEISQMFYKEELGIAFFFIVMSCVLLGTILSQ